MKIGCWNVRSLNGRLTQNKVPALCKQHNIDIFGLLETKISKDKISDVMHWKFRKYNFYTNHDIVKGGRIVIIWNSVTADCQFIEAHSQVVHCRITNKVNAQSFVCSFVYGSSYINNRGDLWSNLISWGINHIEPWMLMGDFNSVLSLEERQGGLNTFEAGMEDFISCTTTLGLEDASFIGSKFTWTNGTIWSKID